MGKRLVLLFTSFVFLLGCARVPPKALGSIRLAYAATPGTALILVALGRGYFKDEGLEIQGTAYTFGKPALASVIRGDADLATTAEAPLINSILAGAAVDILSTIGTSPKDMSVVADRAAGIQGIADLAGRRIGMAKGTIAEFYLDSLLLLHRVDPRSVIAVDTLPEKVAEGLLAGTFSAAAVWSPFVSQARDALGDRAIVLNDESAYLETVVVVSDSAFARSRPEAMKAFLRALIRAEKAVISEPERCIALMATMTKLDVKNLREAFGLYRFRVGLDQALLLVLEQESRWVLGRQSGSGGSTPAFLGHIYQDPLLSVEPARVGIIR